MNQSGEIVTRILATVIGFLVLGGWGLGPLVLLLAGKVRTAPKGSYDEAWAPSRSRCFRRFSGPPWFPGTHSRCRPSLALQWAACWDSWR
jgi:hypothetical protein